MPESFFSGLVGGAKAVECAEMTRVLDLIALHPVLFGQRDMLGIIPRITEMGVNNIGSV